MELGGYKREVLLSRGSPPIWTDPGTSWCAGKGALAKPEPPGAETTELPGPCAQVWGTHPWYCLRVSPLPPKSYPELVPFFSTTPATHSPVMASHTGTLLVPMPPGAGIGGMGGVGGPGGLGVSAGRKYSLSPA